MRVLPLVGHRSITALNAFNALVLGLKMLPIYEGVPYREFYETLGAMEDSEKESKLREALSFVNLDKEELEALVCFCTDKNGIPYGPENLKNLSLDEIFNIVIAVCMEIGRIKISLVSEGEKKNSENSRLTSEKPS